MSILSVAAVHTAGVNWVSVTAIVGTITAIFSVLFGAMAKYITGHVTSAINIFRISVVDELSTRLTVVEGKIDNINSQTGNRGRR
jgi:hypothetical protein